MHNDGVEDEIHFSVKCVALNKERLSLFGNRRKLFPTFVEMDDQNRFIKVTTQANNSRVIAKCLKRNTSLCV